MFAGFDSWGGILDQGYEEFSLKFINDIRAAIDPEILNTLCQRHENHVAPQCYRNKLFNLDQMKTLTNTSIRQLQSKAI